MYYSLELNEKELLDLYKLLRDEAGKETLQAVLKKLEIAVYEVASIDEIEELNDAGRI